MKEKKNISHARALKEKNRLIKKINESKKFIETNINYYKVDEQTNAIINISSKFVDIKPVVEKLNEQIEVLEEIKTKIAVANANNGISALIYKKEEKASYSAYLNILNVVKDNKVPSKYDIGENKVVYVPMVSQISEEEIAQMRKKLEDEISDLQDEIDELNAKTMIEVSIYKD